MYYTIEHRTSFRYSAPIRESVMEVRMQPRTEGNQRCLSFQLTTQPRARISQYRDHLDNIAHHFDIPGQHERLVVETEALVELRELDPLPAALGPDAWGALDDLTAREDHWDMLAPSQFARPSALLEDFAREIGLARRADPLTLLRELNQAIYEQFEYAPQSTRVDSPIDDALRARRGVCQDYSHIMITLGRGLGIPCRYVSGYLFHRTEDHDRSAEDATHAWVEALLPGLGWVGFDPTNNLIAGARHIRVAVGRDYADVPPSRGVFKGRAESELHVAVRVTPAAAPPDEELLPLPAWNDLPLMAQGQQQQ